MRIDRCSLLMTNLLIFALCTCCDEDVAGGIQKPTCALHMLCAEVEAQQVDTEGASQPCFDDASTGSQIPVLVSVTGLTEDALQPDANSLLGDSLNSCNHGLSQQGSSTTSQVSLCSKSTFFNGDVRDVQDV